MDRWFVAVLIEETIRSADRRDTSAVDAVLLHRMVLSLCNAELLDRVSMTGRVDVLSAAVALGGKKLSRERGE